MTDLFKQFETDDSKVNDGVWRDLTRTVQVKIAMAENPAYMRMLRKKYKSNQVALQADDDLSQELSQEITKEIYAHTILLGIRSTDPSEELKINGELMEKYTPDHGLTLLKNEEFFKRIKDFAQDSSEYMLNQEDSVIKN